MKRSRPTKPIKKPAKRVKRVGVYGSPAFYGRPRGLDVELKVADLTSAAYDINTTGTFTLLCVPTLGTDFTNRVGRKILQKKIYVRGYCCSQPALTGAASATTAAQIFRMILFVDTQPNGAVPVTGDLLLTANAVSHLNLNNRDRFKILVDEQFAIDPYVNVVTATQAQACFVNQIKDVKVFKKCSVEAVFNGTNGGTIADITSGAIYMFWIGSTAAGNTDGIAQIATRVRYADV